MTPAALAAIEAKRKAARKSHYISGEGQWHTEEINSADLDALLAHIRTMEAEREEFLKLLVETKAAVDGMPKRIADGVQPLIKAEIAAAVAAERERAIACRPKPEPSMDPEFDALIENMHDDWEEAIREPKP